MVGRGKAGDGIYSEKVVVETNPRECVLMLTLMVLVVIVVDTLLSQVTKPS